ncbi:ATP-binding protein [Haloplanus salilacus]|uniref:ATP-binding protein n=1 Tax=Haloplanus salilacus TaxID=2949994 RepID=UPI0030CE9C81
MVSEAFTAIFLFVSLALWGTAVVAWRRIDSPAVDRFAVAAGTLGTGSFVISLGFAAGDPGFILGTTVSVAMLVPLPWVLFSFDYLGYERLTSTLVSGILAIPVVIGLAATIIIFAGQAFPWFGSATRTDAGELAAVIGTVIQLSQWMGVLYAGGLVLTGTGLILWSFRRYPHLDSTTGTVLGIFGTVPWVSVLFALQLQSTSFFLFSGTIAVGFGIGTVTAIALVGPAALFDRVPAAGNIGPTTVIGELNDAVVITDSEGQVIELNRSASRLFGHEQDAVDNHITDLVGSGLEGLRDRTTVEIKSASGRFLFDPTISDLTDQHDYLVGYTIVFRDVTDRTVKNQRLEVLNRLLRHNLRNDMNVILGRNDVVRTQVDDPAVMEHLDTIAETGEELVEASEKVRKSQQIPDSNSGAIERIRIEALTRQIFERVMPEQAVEYRYQGPEEIAVVATRNELRVALRNLITNAIQHNDSETPTVRVRVTRRSAKKYPLEIAVLDNGPGIPKAERTVIESGQETSLEHSSGIGLWTIRWIMRKLGGKIVFTGRESGGTAVKLLFPTPDPAEFGRKNGVAEDRSTDTDR